MLLFSRAVKGLKRMDANRERGDGGSRHGDAWVAGIEPGIDEVLDDPIIHLVMARDRIDVDEVRTLVATVGRRIGKQAADAAV